MGLGELTDRDVEHIRNSFELLGDDLSDIVADLYPAFLARYPRYAEFFEQTEFRIQRQGVEQLFRTAVPKLDDPRSLEQTLDELASIHAEYGVPEQAYADMGEVFLGILEQYAGEAWSDDLERAWSRLWSELSRTLQREQ